MKNVVVAAGGTHKIKAILAALRQRYFHTLVTDEVTASELLAHIHDNPHSVGRKVP
jgi:DNA-binding transcriptional regulator LsrR (DeoR family)